MTIISLISANKENHLRPPTLSSPLATPPHKRLRALQLNDITHASPSPGPCRSPLRARRFSPRGSLFGSGNSGCGRRSLKTSPACVNKRPSTNPFTPVRNAQNPANAPSTQSSNSRDRLNHPAAVTSDRYDRFGITWFFFLNMFETHQRAAAEFQFVTTIFYS